MEVRGWKCAIGTARLELLGWNCSDGRADGGADAEHSFRVGNGGLPGTKQRPNVSIL